MGVPLLWMMQNGLNLKEGELREDYAVLRGRLDERGRRQWAAVKVRQLGRGGYALVHRVTGMDYKTIQRGLEEVGRGEVQLPGAPGRIRAPGGGRKTLTQLHPGLKEDLEALLEPATRGDPESSLTWVSRSSYHLAAALAQQGHAIAQKSVYNLLTAMGYSLQANRKTLEGGSHADRDAQFSHINAKVKDFQARKQPVISVDTKKKENVGPFKNAGREYHKKGRAPKVNVHDFLDKELGKAAPYGIYDPTLNKGWVSVGVSSDTAQFAVNAIRSWWQEMGRKAYARATQLYINADGGGSNGWRVRLWKTELQKLANETGLDIHISHFPPGTSKWNKIEHKMFCFISQNWRGRPLIDLATIVNLIGNTTSQTGLSIRAILDTNTYPKGIKVSDADFAKLDLHPDNFHGEWNYVIIPNMEVIFT